MGNIRGGMNGFLGTIGQPTAQVIDGSLSFKPSAWNSGSQRLERTPGSSGNRRTWTWSAWVKRGARFSGTNETHLFDSRVNDDDRFYGIAFSGPNDGEFLFVWEEISSGNYHYHKATPSLRDNGWYHLVVTVDTTQPNGIDRVNFYANGKKLPLAAEDGTYPWYSQNYETNVNQASSTHTIGSYYDQRNFDGYICQNYLIDGLALGPGYFGFADPLTNTWRPKKFRAEGTTVNDGTVWSGGIPGNVLSGYPATQGFDGNTSTFVYADNSSTMTWTAPKRITGELIEVYAYAGGNWPILKVNGKSTGAVVSGATQHNVWVDVTDLCGGPGGVLETISAFGQNIGGVDRSSGWSAVRVDGVILTDSTTTNLDFGTNGFYLPMDNQDDFEKDKSGKGNDYTKQNFSGTSINPDIVKDSPSGAIFGGRSQTGITTTSSAPANYATLNPLNINDMGGTTSVTISDGNLTVANARNTYFGTALSTLSMTSGKYYCEATVDSNDATTLLCGILKIDPLESRWNTDDEQIGYFQYGYGYRSNNGNKENNSSNSSYGNSYGDGDTIGIALDLDAKTISFYKNGTNQGVAYSGIPAGQYAFGFSSSETNNKWKANFGQKPFKYAPPQGYLPLNSASARPNKVIPRPDQYVGITTYTGTNASVQKITTEFEADFVWFKSRSGAYNNALFDTVRGATKKLVTNSTGAESTDSEGVKTFFDNGVTVGNSNEFGASPRTYVMWHWKAGGSKNTFNVDGVGYASAAAAGLTGTNYATLIGASVGTKQGFSIIRYQGGGNYVTTVSHGLLQAPQFMLIKNIDDADDWTCYHEGTGNSNYLTINSNSAATDGTMFNDTTPTSTVFTLGAAPGSDYHNRANRSGYDYIGYLWHDVPGLQKFGSYIGNGNADGPYVELGFRPALIWLKRNGEGDWRIWDTTRDPVNVCDNKLYANKSNVETGSSDTNEIDILSNGFKLRSSVSEGNNSGDTYIYCAWAEAPASNLFGGQSNAR